MIISQLSWIAMNLSSKTFTTAERGTFVTTVFAANAVGNVAPTHFVSRRVRSQNYFIRDGPIGSSETANSSCWMQHESYIHFLEHSKKHTNVDAKSSRKNDVNLLHSEDCRDCYAACCDIIKYYSRLS